MSTLDEVQKDLNCDKDAGGKSGNWTFAGILRSIFPNQSRDSTYSERPELALVDLLKVTVLRYIPLASSSSSGGGGGGSGKWRWSWWYLS